MITREGLDTTLAAIGDIRSLITAALGPGGRGVLLCRDSPQQMVITKCGNDILKIFGDSNHLNKIVIDCIQVENIFIFIFYLVGNQFSYILRHLISNHDSIGTTSFSTATMISRYDAWEIIF